MRRARSTIITAITVGMLASLSVQAVAQQESAATGSFGPAGSLIEPRFGNTATLLPDGRILVVGGYAYGALASAEVWDPATAIFGPAGSLTDGRRNPTDALLPDGRVVIVGGEGDFDNVAAAEVWVPATDSPEP